MKLLKNNIKQDKIIAKFKKAFQAGPTDSCWEWRGEMMTAGYGDFSYGNKKGPHHYRDGAHRFSWMLHNDREVPAGMYVCHTCDNKKCVNPGHLWLGSQVENMQDAKRKGRLCFGDRMRAAQKGKMPSGASHHTNRLNMPRNELGQFGGYGS